MLNMLVTCEHWRSLTLTYVEGEMGVGWGGRGVPPSSGGSWLTAVCRNLGRLQPAALGKSPRTLPCLPATLWKMACSRGMVAPGGPQWPFHGRQVMVPRWSLWPTAGPCYGHREPAGTITSGPCYGHRGPTGTITSGPCYGHREPTGTITAGPCYGHQGLTGTITAGPCYGHREPTGTITAGPCYGHQGSTGTITSGPCYGHRGPRGTITSGPCYGHRGPTGTITSGPCYGHRGPTEHGPAVMVPVGPRWP